MMNLVSTATPSIMAKLTVRKCSTQTSHEENPLVSSKSGKHVPISKNHVPPIKRKSVSKAKDLLEVEDTKYIEDSEMKSVRDISSQT